MLRSKNMHWGMLAIGMACAIAANAAYAEDLPVYKLQEPKVDRGRANAMFNAAMERKPEVKETPNAVILRSGRKVLEIDKRSGHAFMGDMERLWNPQARPNLPSQAQAKARADEFLRANGFAMRTGGNVTVEFSHHSESGVSEDVPGAVQKQLLDRQVNYSGKIRVRGAGGQEQTLPLVGGGAKYQVMVGEGGNVIGFNGGLREVGGVAAQAQIKTRDAAIAEFRKDHKGNVKNVRAELAYYAAPAFEKQEYLAPVWVIHSEVQSEGQTVPARIQIIAATQEYGPKTPASPPVPARNPNEKPPVPTFKDEKPQQHGFLDWLITPAHAAYGNDCGTSWIGVSQGLSGSYYNKKGFVDGCKAAGWTVRFDFGEGAAWESDWRRNDDSYVDNVDLVFYTGHANQYGWVLNAPDDTFLHHNEVGGAADYWGNNDVEWIIIAACGPLQSTHFTTNTTNAFDRWRNAFDRLHVLMGYGSVTYDNTREGGRFMELTRAGWNVIDAWFRTALEIQPSYNGWSPPNGSRIYAVAMYAHNGDHCARDDHLWGMGKTCADVPAGSSQQRHMLWSGT